MDRNPYRREYLIKKHFGKTKEERKKKKQEFEESLKAHKAKIDADLLNKELGIDQQKIQEIKEKRAKLGLDENDGKDEIIEDMELNKTRKDLGLKDPFEGLQDYVSQQHLKPYVHKRINNVK